MSNKYRHNHYVPEWYQKRFIDPAEKDQVLHYLDLKPATFTGARGIRYQRNERRRIGPKYCFTEDDLYTTTFGQEISTEIEQYFFGQMDSNGRKAVKYFTDFMHPSHCGDHLNNLLLYMSTQKLRTPKGLKWLSNQVGTEDQNRILRFMLELRQMYCAIWTECVWQIADASQSNTKLIISDHPVTVYNRRCGPHSIWCRDANDPDIIFQASHTIFPLSLEKILILTNLSWVRNPNQKETDLRPNPNLFRSAMFKILDIQVLRHLNEQEVREINFIIKSRAFRYIAAGKREWLYPEEYVSKSNWNTYGHGYLLMPDPRSVHAGGEILIGFKDGTSIAFDTYGRRPWEADYGKENGKNSREFDTLHRFQGEFARLFGPYRRGRIFQVPDLEKEKDSDDFHQYHLSLENMYKRKRRK